MNKYLRNCAFRHKAWKRIRSKSHPFETDMPFVSSYYSRTYEDQIKRNFEWIAEQARAIDKGTHRGTFHAPKHYRKILNDARKSQEKHAMDRIRQGDYNVVFPKWKRDADWLWF